MGLAAIRDLAPTTLNLLLIIEAHAKSGERALSNEAYGGMILVSPSAVTSALKTLLCEGLIVTQKNGMQQRRFFAVRANAWTKVSEKVFQGRERPVTVARKCLCCGEKFPSEGIGNRICVECKRRDGPPDWRDTGRPAPSPTPPREVVDVRTS